MLPSKSLINVGFYETGTATHFINGLLLFPKYVCTYIKITHYDEMTIIVVIKDFLF